MPADLADELTSCHKSENYPKTVCELVQAYTDKLQGTHKIVMIVFFFVKHR